LHIGVLVPACAKEQIVSAQRNEEKKTKNLPLARQKKKEDLEVKIDIGECGLQLPTKAKKTCGLKR